MEKDFEGNFTASLMSLELQMNTLLEEVGGDEAKALLDSVSNLSRCEQKQILGLFRRVVNQVVAGEKRVYSDEDKRLAEFEEQLFQDVLRSLDEIELKNKIQGENSSLKVIKGGIGRAQNDDRITRSKPQLRVI